jgi:uncharacterized membrane protein
MDRGRLEAFSDGVFAVAITLLVLKLAIGVAYLSAPVSLLMSLLVAVYYIFEQTPGRRATPAGREPGPGE